MKSFIAIALVAFSGVARAEPTCDDCLTFAGNMLAYLQTDESLAVQIGVLSDVICPGAPDPAGCVTGVEAHWADIGLAMYPVFLDPTGLCGTLGACKVKTLVSEATCEECVGGVAAVSAVISADATVADVMTFLKGDAYCMGEETCSAYIDAFMPYAMPVLGATLESEAETLCCENSPSGVCC